MSWHSRPGPWCRVARRLALQPVRVGELVIARRPVSGKRGDSSGLDPGVKLWNVGLCLYEWSSKMKDTTALQRIQLPATPFS